MIIKYQFIALMAASAVALGFGSVALAQGNPLWRPAIGRALGLDMVIRVLRGEPVPKRIITETPVITRDNVDDFYDPDSQYVR